MTDRERELSFSDPEWRGTTAVYRFFNADRALLYVGISRSLADRWNYHRCRTTWYPQVRWMALSFYPGRHQAFQAENGAIVRDDPLFNVLRPNPKRGRWNAANPLNAPPPVDFPRQT